jgi:hypothetical protein
MATRRGERKTLGEVGEIFVESQQFVSTRHVLARRIDQNDNRRTIACLHCGENVTSQQDRSVNAQWSTANDTYNCHFALTFDLGAAVQRSRWPALYLMTGREKSG